MNRLSIIEPVTIGSRAPDHMAVTPLEPALMTATGGNGLRAESDQPADRVLARWVKRMRAEGLAKRTIMERPRIVRRAAITTGSDPLAFTADDIVDYLADLPSPATKNTYYGALRSWHAWLLVAEARPDDPMAGIRRPRVPRRSAHPVSTSHIDVLLTSGIRGRTRTAVLLCSYQGLRVHEAAKIRGEDVDLIAQTLRVVGKGGLDEIVPLHPLIAAEAERYPRRGYWFPSYTRPGQPVHSTSLSACISRAMHRSGIPASAHSLRHWYATELLEAGADARTVQTLMRHASLATLQIYTLVSRDRQRAAIHRLPTPRAARDPGGVHHPERTAS